MQANNSFLHYQLRFVRLIRPDGRIVTYPGYARIKRSGPRPTILDQANLRGFTTIVATEKGPLQRARDYLGRLTENRGLIPKGTTWEGIMGVVLTRHASPGTAVFGPLKKGSRAIERGSRRTMDTTEWLYFINKKDKVFKLDSKNKKLV